jgi:hypothetical protein
MTMCPKCGKELGTSVGHICNDFGKPAMLTGWLCPRCQKVHGPFVQTCDCPPDYILSTGINTEFKDKF